MRIDALPRTRGRHFRSAFVLLALTPLLGACNLDKLLSAKDPFTVTPPVARDTANLETLYAGARSEFALALGGQQNREGGVVMVTGLMADELYSSDNFSTRRAVDTRTIDYDISNASSDHAFVYLQRARAEALNAIDLYASSPRAGDARHSELYSIAGYSVLMLVENFCTGIPLSRIAENGTEFGSPMSATELYTLAISYFDQALAQPSASPDAYNLARVGKGRALLGVGQFAQAAQAVASVPTSFHFDIEYAPGAFETPNPIYNFNVEEHRIGASRQEGSVNKGLNFGAVAAADPRVTIDPTPVASNSGDVLTYLQEKYTDQGSPITLASGVEARLIEAEAQLSNGTSGTYVTALNSLRGTIGLGGLTDPGSAAARVDQLFAERAYWLWLTGHRLSDMRRLVRQYNRSQANVFPTGATAYGLPYGTDVSLPIPFEEVNNPNYTTCTNRGA